MASRAGDRRQIVVVNFSPAVHRLGWVSRVAPVSARGAVTSRDRDEQRGVTVTSISRPGALAHGHHSPAASRGQSARCQTANWSRDGGVSGCGVEWVEWSGSGAGVDVELKSV